MTNDQVFVPKASSELNLPPLDPAREDVAGEHVSKEVVSEMWEALGDSPISTTVDAALNLVGGFALCIWLAKTIWCLRPPQLCGWPSYLIHNAIGQHHRLRLWYRPRC